MSVTPLLWSDLWVWSSIQAKPGQGECSEKEILNDWQAVVVAFVSHPHLPVTNNEAEHALRHAVIARSITHGTRSAEGSQAYAALFSVIETCRRRNLSLGPT